MNTRHPRFEILSGLPPYGPSAEPFTATGQGTHRQGFVVRFYPSHGESWVGNFQPCGLSLRAVEEHPDGARLIVISGGQVYIIDPNNRKYVEFIGAGNEQIIHIGDVLLLITATDFKAIGSEGQRWNRRVSWDGIRNFAVDPTGHTITGEGWTPVTDEWIRFELDVASGVVTGGPYDGPE